LALDAADNCGSFSNDVVYRSVTAELVTAELVTELVTAELVTIQAQPDSWTLGRLN
jgi:hypothetical protein